MNDVPQKARENLAAKTIKELLNTSGSMTSRGTVHLSTGGKKLPVQARPTQSNKNQMETSTLQHIMKKEGFSFERMRRLMKAIRLDFGRDSVQPNTLSSLRKLSHSQDEFFELRCCEFTKQDGTTYSQDVPMIKDVNQYVEFMCNQRGLIMQDLYLKIGIDEGQGFLKVSIICTY